MPWNLDRSDLADPRTTEEDRRQIKAAPYFGNVWDNDFVPLDNYRGFNLGNRQYARAASQLSPFTLCSPASDNDGTRLVEANVSWRPSSSTNMAYWLPALHPGLDGPSSQHSCCS